MRFVYTGCLRAKTKSSAKTPVKVVKNIHTIKKRFGSVIQPNNNVNNFEILFRDSFIFITTLTA